MALTQTTTPVTLISCQRTRTGFLLQGIAQSGRVRDLDSRGRWFESNYPDHLEVVMTFKRLKRPVNRVFIHCSASDAEGPNYEGTGLVQTIDRWHKERGWRGIGYHLVIDKLGNIMRGRDFEDIPAAQAGHNRGSIAICLHGLVKDRFTEKQLNSLLAVCQEIHHGYKGQITFHGHCEVSAKSCPVIDYKKLLDLDRHGRLRNV